MEPGFQECLSFDGWIQSLIVGIYPFLSLLLQQGIESFSLSFTDSHHL